MAKPTIAAFDFDRTITNCDSLLPFLVYTHGAMITAGKMFYLLPLFTGYIFGLKSRQHVKETVLHYFYKGISKEKMEQWGESFAKEKIPGISKPAAIKRIQWHQAQGHRCILISANLDCYLYPWAKSVGFEDVICSKLEYDSNGLFTGKLQGLNCWGPEKARRLEELVGPREGYVLYAYGDSRGDREVLFLADFRHYRKMPVETSEAKVEQEGDKER